MKIRNMRNLSLHTDNHETAVTIGHRLTGNLSRIQAGKMICLVDQNVMKYHADKLKDYRCIIVEPGELHKSLAYAEKLMRRMIEYEVDRSSFLVGIGGGLVTDLAGFVASVYMRGIRFGFISTTLLGQVDASIGGKNGVNLDGYKNMVGIIRQPEFVWCDLDFL